MTINLPFKRIFQKILKRKKQQFAPRLLKPFTVKDLNPVSSEWSIHPPSFVGVAAPKSGTSWWHSLILEHPQVVTNRLKTKELHYFDHLKFRDISEEEIATYCQAFASPKTMICGEWTPNYLTHPFCLKNLAKAAPNTKIVLLLRNPVDRMISHMNFQAYSRLDRFHFNQNERYIYYLYTIYLNSCLHSYYTIGLRELLRYFERSQILILQYEKCQLYPLEEIKKTYHFLEIDSQYKPKEIEKYINKTKLQHVSINTEERQVLTQFFKEEMESSHQLFPEIDLSLWLR